MQKEIPLNVEYHYCDCLLARLGVGFVSFHLNMKMNAFMIRPHSPDTHKGFILTTKLMKVLKYSPGVLP